MEKRMRTVAIVVLALSICGMPTFAAASVMDGKGSMRSYKGEVTKERAFKRLKEKETGKNTCSAYANACRKGRNNVPICQARYSHCMKTGTYVGAHNIYTDMVRK
jgi:hypothetical protein